MWCCSRCGNLFNSIATSNATIHLNKQHRVHESSEPSTATATATTSTSDIIIPRRKRGASTLAEMLRTNAVKRPKDPIFKTQADLFRHTFVNWMADSDIPFAVVESRHFRQILHMLNTTLATALLPKGGDTMRSWLDEIYQEEFERIKSLLAAAPYKKHLSFDLRTSPGNVALLAVVVHYFSVLGTHQTHLLGLPRIRGSHTGEDIAVGVREVIEQFGLTDQLGYFQSDNMAIWSRKVLNLSRLQCTEWDY
jgi:hypothetical protein